MVDLFLLDVVSATVLDPEGMYSSGVLRRAHPVAASAAAVSADVSSSYPTAGRLETATDLNAMVPIAVHKGSNRSL